MDASGFTAALPTCRCMTLHIPRSCITRTSWAAAAFNTCSCAVTTLMRGRVWLKFKKNSVCPLSGSNRSVSMTFLSRHSGVCIYVAEFDLNLSTRPFPAYRLINVALAVILAVLLVLSAWQATGFARYSRLARVIRTGEIDARVEAETLGKRVAELESPLDRPEATAKLNEIGFLNRLIARKSLSWTKLFADLEEMVPNNVHLVSLTPEFGTTGGIILRIDLEARNVGYASEFIHRLEKSPVFEGIVVSTEQKRESTPASDVTIRLSA